MPKSVGVGASGAIFGLFATSVFASEIPKNIACLPAF
jgi:membrane associated rhomboid family serine protease